MPRYFRDPEAARRQGRALLAAGTRPRWGQARRPRADELEYLHRRDLRLGDVAIADGWILSRTEAEACMQLAAMKGQDRAG